MMSMINRILDWIKSLFWKEEMELTLVGLQNSGKTTFVNVIAVRYPHFMPIVKERFRVLRMLPCCSMIIRAFAERAIYRGYDPNRRLQHEEDHQRQRDDKSLF